MGRVTVRLTNKMTDPSLKLCHVPFLLPYFFFNNFDHINCFVLKSYYSTTGKTIAMC